MERETSISKRGFFTKLAKEVKEKYKINVWFAEILGKRWSYLGGEESSDYLIEKIQLEERLGLVIAKGLDKFEYKKEEILKLIRDRLNEFCTEGNCN
ncbi:MAG: hypothetical protein NC898_06545 [Candidatus Omnitrophica bacterium]|nr:hypothetical protein [Candidatus Omnitrophota bacterium]MCM8794093.1 hypothetical protein [Candidatus Omnitrophota bacterium]